MFDKKTYKETFSTLHASEDTLTEVYKVIDNSKRNARRPVRRLSAVLIAAALILAFCVTAYATNLFGLREMWSELGREQPLSPSAAEMIERHDEYASTEGWSVRVTESYCDEYTVLVTATVSCGDKYVLAPSWIMVDEPVSVIGLEGDETLAEYAASRGKTIRKMGATLDMPEGLAGNVNGNVQWRNVSDSEMVVIKYIGKRVSTPSLDVVLRVWASDPEAEQGSRSRGLVEIPLSLTEAATSEAVEFMPVDPDAVPGLHIGTASLTQTPLGFTLIFPVNGDDYNASQYKIFYCDEISDWMLDTLSRETDLSGIWLGTGGRGTVDDTLTMHICDSRTDELIGDIVFKKQ